MLTIVSMSMVRKIRQNGNSASITLPKTILEVLEISMGDAVEFDIVGDTVVMRRAHSSSPLGRAQQLHDTAAKNLERLLAQAPLETEALSEAEEAAVARSLKHEQRR